MATEKPILFTGEMVRAILDGQKTMTRRVVFTGKESRPGYDRGTWDATGYDVVNTEKHTINRVAWTPDAIMEQIRCPYGKPGDRLWVRETYRAEKYGGLWAAFDHAEVRVEYAAGYGPGCEAPNYFMLNGEAKANFKPTNPGKWKPSIFMPRWASRITLEVTNVRVERVQEISEEDAIAEGVKPCVWGQWWQGYREFNGRLIHQQASGDNPPDWMIDPKPMGDMSHLDRSAKQEFEMLWDSINAKRGFEWDANPWVWVIAFKRID